MPAGFAHILLFSIVAVSVLLMLIRPRNIAEVYWIGSGVVLLLVLRLIPLRMAGSAAAKGADVYFFLIGMMLLSELARENGVFDWLSSVAVRAACGSSSRLFALIYSIGAIVTICMSNDATAVVLTPAVLAATRHAKVTRPLPFLFACAMIANAASFVLPISNPANLVVFHSHMPPLGRWMLSFLAPSVFSIAVTFAALRWYFRNDLRLPIDAEVDAVPLNGNGKLVLFGLITVVGVLLTASAFDKDLGLPTCIAALIFTAVVCIKRRSSPLPLAKEISWSTLALVAGLFIMVQAVENAGALQLMERALAWTCSLPPAAGATLAGSVVALGNNLFNNLPVGLIAGAALSGVHVHGLIANAVLIGVDLGPNLSVTGSLATILWLLALRRENLNVSFVDFLKAGLLAMPAALIASIAAMIAIHLLGAG